MVSLAVALVSIIIINLVLSGDNALMIAMACRRLPAVQQKRAIFIGTCGAVALRIILTIAAVYILRIPFLQVAGGLMLIWIAVRLLVDDTCEDNVCEAGCFWEAVKTIMVADFIMSLDNILGVAAAARGNIWLLIFGLALSIPVVVFCSSLITGLMKRFPFLVAVGAAILGWTAAEMIMRDKLVQHFLGAGVLPRVVPLLAAAGVVFGGLLLARRQRAHRCEPDKH
ncbi:TerC family protein [Desulfotomaculum copahuensis]|uniref:Tellurium resistance protein TerC n=1 Tax=Desulfotomaculum copahuensis TaxID=1838280 RepID=A0A1B7LGK5_9FIRM|nr:TerC family protein [Desulfotomaculum copahuensis]OAT85237.1 hypothetical protein A6M21_06755 [Desulfotomaculum copahuensis]